MAWAFDSRALILCNFRQFSGQLRKLNQSYPTTTYDAPSLSYLYTTMSAAAEGSGPITKATTTTDTSSTLKDQQKPAAALEEDDEFEDFPVDGTCA